MFCCYFEFYCDFFDQVDREINFLFRTTIIFDENWTLIREKIGLQQIDVCIAYMPEDGMYIHTQFHLDLSHILGENFNINKVVFVVKTGITYMALEFYGSITLWDDKE